MTLFNQLFLSTFLRRQPFDFPDSIIYYILKNPKSSKVYQKLIKTCKYFFIKNPILVIHCLKISDDGWKICSNQGNCKADDLKKIIDSRIISNCKLWIDHRIRIISTNSNAASDLIPKIYQCDAEKTLFVNQNMSLQQLLFYAQNAVSCWLENTFISSDVSAEIPVEEIIANLQNIIRIWVKYGLDSRNASSETAKKLLQIPHFKNMIDFNVVNASEKFDIDPIYEHYKKNRSQFTFSFVYQQGLSEGFTKKLDEIVNEILADKFLENETPMIQYPEQNIDIYRALNELYKKSLSIR